MQINKSLHDDTFKEKHRPIRCLLCLTLAALIIFSICSGCATINKLNLYSDEDAMLSAANQWARALQYRDGNIRYGLMTPELQKVFFKKDKTVVSREALFKEKGMIVIGWSSPWVDHYEIQLLENPNEVRILYTMTDSTQTFYKMTEDLTFSVKQDKATVIAYKTSELSPITNTKSTSFI